VYVNDFREALKLLGPLRLSVILVIGNDHVAPLALVRNSRKRLLIAPIVAIHAMGRKDSQVSCGDIFVGADNGICIRETFGR
jgi:hypothetical protein